MDKLFAPSHVLGLGSGFMLLIMFTIVSCAQERSQQEQMKACMVSEADFMGSGAEWKQFYKTECER